MIGLGGLCGAVGLGFRANFASQAQVTCLWRAWEAVWVGFRISGWRIEQGIEQGIELGLELGIDP